MHYHSSLNRFLLVTAAIGLLLALAACVAVTPAAPAPSTQGGAVAPAGAQPATIDYASYKPILGAYSPVALAAASQASCKTVAWKPSKKPSIAYMPPATEFDYYIAIGEGVKAQAAQLGADTYMSAPQSGSDINGQMGMLQDVITKKADAIIFSTHDENAAAPLVKRAVDAGIAVIIVNSDIPTFPAPVHAVVGYGQRRGTYKMGMYVAGIMKGVGKLGVLEGQPGWHSTERIGGYLDALSQFPQIKKIASLPTAWNVETGNSAMMDMMQAHPEINVVVAANDYEAIGAAKAAQSLNRKDILIFGNDGDTTGMEQIYDGTWNGTVNTTPFEMGEVAMQVAWDCLNGTYPGGWTETPVVIVDKTNVLNYLCHPERLYPKPSKKYDCPNY